MIAKPIMAVLLALVCLGAAACSSTATQQANRERVPDAGEQVDQAVDAATAVPTIAQESTVFDSPDGATATPDELNSLAADERGGRAGSDEELPADAPDLATATAEPNINPAPTATPASVAVDEPMPTPTPVATTEPLPTPEPLAPVEPTTAAVVTPPVTQDPDPAFTAPAPTGPVPSDDIVVQGPTVDESEPVIISDSGASACALTESAIDSLDIGDLNRTAEVLQEASVVAERAAEPEIAGMASQLAAAGADEEAAVAAIIATLNACAIHGYQV